MFTIFLKNSKESDEVYSYVLNNFNLPEATFKKNKNQIIFNFKSYNASHQNFAINLSNLIIDLYELKIIKKIIKRNYFYFDELEQVQISNISSSIVDENSQSKKDLVYLSINEYIQDNTSMILDGFIRFRLKDYIEVLEYLVDLSVNNFIINREYDKFITLLCDYINSEPSKIDIVHLIYIDKEAILLDKYKNPIPIDENILDAKYLSDISFSNNDYVLNTLLNLLPNKLYVHVQGKEDEFLTTLKRIFNNKIILCHDCDICSFYKSLSSSNHSTNHNS